MSNMLDLDRDFPHGLNNEKRPLCPVVERMEEKPYSLHPQAGSEDPCDAGVARKRLRPTAQPPPRACAADSDEKLRVVDDFCARLATIAEGDYGDWMRRANLYWYELRDALGDQPPDVWDLMQAMHIQIQYQPDFRLIETRRRVVAMALDLRRQLERGAEIELDLHDFFLEYTLRSAESSAPPYSLRLDEPIRPNIEAYVAGGNALSINGELGGQSSLQS